MTVKLDDFELNLSQTSRISIVTKDDKGYPTEIINLVKNNDWTIDKTIKLSREQLLKDYFEECKEDNGFDSDLIERMCAEYSLNKAIFKADIAQNREKFIESH